MQNLDSPFTAPLMWLAGLGALVAICLGALRSETISPGDAGAFVVSAAGMQASATGTNAPLEVRVESVQDGWRIINTGVHGWADCLAEIGTARAHFSLRPAGSDHIQKVDFEPQPKDWKEPHLSCARGEQRVSATLKQD